MPAGHNFKRINFFEGFFTTDDDWNAGEAYHVEKRRLHNRVFHQPGIVPVLGGGLKVTSRGRGDLSFEVAPGFAIDGRGNEIVLREPAVRIIDVEKLRLPQTVYVGIRYFEEPADFIAYKENPRFKGHRRIEEKCRVEVLPSAPDNDEVIELARVRLDESVRELRDVLDPRVPGVGELDLRFAPVAGLAGAHAPPRLRVGLGEALEDLQSHAGAIARLGVLSAAFLRQTASTAAMLNGANAVGPYNLAEVLSGVVELAREMLEDVEQSHPHVAARKGFGDFRKSLEALQRLVRDRPRDPEGCASIVRFLSSANAALQAVVREKTEPAKEQQAQGETLSWKDVVYFSRPFPKSLRIDGNAFAQVDHIQLVDEDSMRRHRFVIEGEKDKWRSRQSFTYPDRVEVSDTGIAWVDGASRFTVTNLTPGRDLIIIKRYDAILGEQQCEILADGKRVGTWKSAESDRKHRWRNHYFLVPGSFISGEQVEITKKALSAERDINLFQLWFFQPA